MGCWFNPDGISLWILEVNSSSLGLVLRNATGLGWGLVKMFWNCQSAFWFYWTQSVLRKTIVFLEWCQLAVLIMKRLISSAQGLVFFNCILYKCDRRWHAQAKSWHSLNLISLQKDSVSFAKESPLRGLAIPSCCQFFQTRGSAWGFSP